MHGKNPIGHEIRESGYGSGVEKGGVHGRSHIGARTGKLFHAYF